MNTWTLAHGRDGYELHLGEVSAWRYLVARTYEHLLDLTGHPCCSTRLTDRLPVRLRERAEAAQFRLLNNRVAYLDHPPRRQETVPVTDAQAEQLHPRFCASVREMLSP